ncbi:hypothetical protein M0R04_04195 [Candidatus Dojkabacteria bacterium]|jgi:hypothetical protein|nr:hypothetical protein [Candidatus Dojkabacteria bacterium]
MITGYECFCLYNALKLHFTSSYDYFKYNGKTHIKSDSFEKRKDKYYFYKLSRKISNKEALISFLVANFLENEKIWIGDLLTDESEVVFLNQQKFMQSISYSFENECRIIFDDVINPNDVLKTSGDYPQLLTLAFRKEVHVETLCILNMILGFLPMWKARISDNIRWPEYQHKITKYSPFLPQDMTKFKKILQKVL